MAEEIFSFKEKYPTLNLEDTWGLDATTLTDMFGSNDIRFTVEDKENFLNKEFSFNNEQFTDKMTKAEKYEADKKLVLDNVNAIRESVGLTNVPYNQLSEEQIQAGAAIRAAQKMTEMDRLYASDPIQAKNKAWRGKLDNDKRNWQSIFGMNRSGERQDGPQGPFDKMFPGNESEVLDYFDDSFMGLSNTAMRYIPDINKKNVSIFGDVISTFPLLFASHKKLLASAIDPKKKKTMVAEASAFSGVGAYSAATAYDGLNAIYRELEGIEDPELSTDPKVVNAIHARNAALFTGGAAGLYPLFEAGKKGIRAFYGIKAGSNAEDLAKLSLDQNIPFGIKDVSDGGFLNWVKAWPKVAGVFPFIGTDIRASRAQIQYYTDKRVQETLNELAPMSHAMDAGMLITEKAKEKFKIFERVSAKMYDDFFKKAMAMDSAVPGGYIPTYRIKTLAQAYEEQIKASTVPLRGYPEGRAGADTIGGGKNLTDFEIFLLDLGRTEDFIGAVQFRGLQKQFNQKWAEYATKFGVKEGDDLASQARYFKNALEEGLNDIKEWRLPVGQGGLPDPALEQQMKFVKTSLLRANEVFGFGANNYTTPLAKAFELVDQNMFIAGALPKSGFMYSDQLSKYIFDTFKSGNPSREALKDLSKIVTRNYKNPELDPINVQTRAYLSEIYDSSSVPVAYNPKTGAVLQGRQDINSKIGLESSLDAALDTAQSGFNPEYITVNVFDPSKFRAKLGLNSNNGTEFMKEIWAQTMAANGKKLSKEGGEAAVKNLNDLLRIAEVGFATKLADTSSFVARRAALAGFSGIGGAFLATSTGIGPLGGLAIALLAKKNSKILSSPENLNWMVKVMDDTLDQKVRRSNWIKLSRVIFSDESLDPKLEGIDFEDPEEVLRYLFKNQNVGSEPTMPVEEKIAPAPGAPDNKQIVPPKTYAPNFPRSNNQSNNVSGEIKTKPMASNMSSPFRPLGGAQRGQLNPQQRAALAGGNIYGAIATAKRGGAIYRDGIMNLAGRRRT